MRGLTVLRVALVAFVVVWLFGPYALRSSVPIWLVFLIALGLEVNYFAGAFRPSRARAPDRGPQPVDRERYGYDWEDEDERDEEVAERGLPVRQFLVGLGVIAALVVLIWAVDSRSGWDAVDSDARAKAEERFSDEASRVAGKSVTIRCDESGNYVGAVQHADGVALVGGDLAYLTPERCLDLYRLAFKGEERSSQTARSLAVLAHEAWHLRGEGNEGKTECYALQSGVELGRRLGLSASTARRLMRQQLTENALRRKGNLEYLVPPECRNGGPLDLDPDSDKFP
ncbi:MAG: hypothetical protein H0V11_03150 [Actinobacteria bacterium]|nr:hypothetical protein [Actinomycetota bacterium]